MDSPEPQQSRFGILSWLTITWTLRTSRVCGKILDLWNYELFWTIWTNLCNSARFWTNMCNLKKSVLLCDFEQTWAILDNLVKSVQLCSISDESVWIWAILNQSVQIYAILDKSVQLWTILDNFEQICATLRDYGQFWTNLCSSVILDDFGKLRPPQK